MRSSRRETLLLLAFLVVLLALLGGAETLVDVLTGTQEPGR